MRLVLLFVCVCFVSSSFGQTPYLERRITLSFDNESIENSLKKISAAAGFVFSYNPDIIGQRKVVTHAFVNRSVREILDEIFEGTIQYKARGKYIILTAAPERSSRNNPAIVTGYVIDESTGERLKDVSIYDPLTLTSTLTDSYGYFEIKIDRAPSDIILSVNRQNYTDTVFSIPEDGRLLNIPIKLNREKLAVLADSVSRKLHRLWDRQETWFNNINILNIDDSLFRTFQVSLVPFVGTNHKMSAHVTNDYSLNVLGGYALGVRKLEIGGLFNLVRGDVSGAQFAGLLNIVGGRMTGFQVAGILNENTGRVTGVQVAGALNINTDDATGFSLAGVGNVAAGQTAPAQIGGVFNVADGEVKGPQIAGVFNVAAKEVKGAQIAGVLNVARKVLGVQIGLINIADSVRGIPIGLMSIVGKGYHKIEISADEIFYNNIAFRTGVRHFYNIFHAGAKPATYRQQRTVWTFGYGLGTSAKLSRRLFLDFDVTSNQIVDGNSIDALNLLNRLYLGFDIQAFRKLSLSMGATLNGLITESEYDTYPALFTDYQPKIFLERSLGRDHDLKMWVGAKVGLRFL